MVRRKKKSHPWLSRPPLYTARHETTAHRTARCSAPMAGFYAGPHLHIVGKSCAVRRATLTDFGARLTHEVRLIRAAEHKVRARLAKLYTVRDQPHMRLLRMSPAYSQAMMDRDQADVMTRLAVGNAVLNVPPLLRG